MNPSTLTFLVLLFLFPCHLSKYTNTEIINMLKSREKQTNWSIVSKQLIENKKHERSIVKRLWSTLNPYQKSQISIREFLDNVALLPGIAGYNSYFTKAMEDNRGVFDQAQFGETFFEFLQLQSQNITIKQTSDLKNIPASPVICDKDLFLLDQACVPCSEPNQYKDLEKGTCYVCDKPCRRCSSPTVCEVCPEGFLSGANGRCQQRENPSSCEQCADGSSCYGGACRACDSKCAKCEGPSKCLECSEGFFLRPDGSCTRCDSIGVFVKNGVECRDCVSHCQRCASLSECFKCESGFYHLYGKCVACDQDGYFVRGEYCRPCSIGCRACTDESTCVKCVAGQFLQGGGCSASCDTSRGYFISMNAGGNQICEKCADPKCLVCKEANYCEACSSQHVAYGGVCVDCANSEDSKRVPPEALSACLKCPENCEECYSSTKCYLCKDDYYLTSLAQCSRCNATGVVKSYDFLSRKSCVSCPMNCVDCVNPKFCLRCSPNYSLSFGQCLPCTEDTMLMIPEQKTCKPCSPLCSACASSSSCKKCQPLFFFLHGDCFPCTGPNYIKMGPKDGSGTCVTPCNSGEYMAIDANNHKICAKCPENCRTCETGQVCFTCKPNFYKFDGGCVPCNKPGQLRSPDDSGHGECLTCSQNCGLCYDLNSCYKCLEGFSLTSDGRCVTACSPGVTILQTDALGRKICKDICIKNCARCRENGVCEVCDMNYFLAGNGKICTPCTGPGEKKSLDDKNTPVCSTCQLKNCQVCDSASKCRECKRGYYNMNGECVTCTGMGQFLTPDNRCVSCGKNCMLCQSERFCKICYYGFIAQQGVCVGEIEPQSHPEFY